MKIGLLTSHRAQKQYEREYGAIIDQLVKRGFEVVHSLQTTLEHLEPLSYAEREAIFLKFYQELEDCELVFVELSMQSVQLGYGMSYLRSKGKPIVVLSLKNALNDLSPKGTFFSNIENMMAYEYTPETISSVLTEAIEYMAAKVDKRFTMVFPASLYAQLEETAKQKKLPKAVYIRQLIEQSLK
ncbi:MAG TPA: hypothetical protein VN711_03330 [Candidatus Saccharimonadales bacterium]|nr:hypothetical protein [Candidatus Saccharimonadales bacterium]